MQDHTSDDEMEEGGEMAMVWAAGGCVVRYFGRREMKGEAQSWAAGLRALDGLGEWLL